MAKKEQQNTALLAKLMCAIRDRNCTHLIRFIIFISLFSLVIPCHDHATYFNILNVIRQKAEMAMPGKERQEMKH